MNEERIQQIKDQIKALISEITSIGEEPPDFIVDLLSKVIEKAQNEINSLRQGGGTLKVPPIDPAMPSSNVEGFAYDDKNGKLFVRFLGKYPNRNGPVYSYQGVPPEIFQLFKTGAVPARTNGRNKWGSWWKGKHPSMGASLYTLLKTANYPYQRVA